MKKIVFALFTMVFLLFVFQITVSHAAPFVVCDPYSSIVTQPTEFEVYLDGSTTAVISPAQSVTGGVRLYYDVGSIGVGNHTATVKAVRVDAAWGRLTSASSAPFAFTRPAAPATSTGIGLIP